MKKTATPEQAALPHNAKSFTPIPCVLLFLLLSSSLHAQTKLWSHVSTTYNPKTSSVTLTPNQIQSIRTILRSSVEEEMWGCGDDPEDRNPFPPPLWNSTMRARARSF